jgi:iron complex outermembrane recepter protein
MKGLDRSRSIARFALTCSMAALAMPAVAQATAEDTGGLEDIVVTAQKREQNLQDVPIAISAISAAKIEQLGISDSRDLSGLAPNVTITQGTTSNAAAVISIRGIPTPAGETFGLDTANALYVDGIYIARSGASGMDVMDIQRVEVLRGPQGTLFGRNTTGGAIAFISRAPSESFQLKAEAGYGNFNAWNGKISLDPGAIMGISTSFSYSRRQRDGVVDNILQPDKGQDPGARKSDAFRFAARAEIGSTGSIQYIFDWSKTIGNPNNFQLTNVGNATPRSVTVGGQALVVTQTAPVQQYLAGVTFANPACAALAAPTRIWRDRVCNDISSVSRDRTFGHNLQVENDFGGFKIKSTTGYRSWANDSNTDLDGLGAFSGPAFSNATLFNGMPASLLQFIPTIPAAARGFIASSPVPTVTQNLFDTNNVRRHRQFSQEVEVSGDSDMLDWVMGGYFFWEKGSENNPQNSGFVLDTNTVFTANFGALGPSFVAANPARYRLVVSQTPLRYTASSESTAVYGQATFYPGGRDSGLRLTAGARYTWDTKWMQRSQNGAAPFASPQTNQKDFSSLTWNLMLGYDIADGITTYARAATGYKSGGFNAAEGNVTNTLTPFNEETLTSFEIGVKTELLDRRLRLNVAGYYNQYKDLQIALPVVGAPAGTFATIIGNAGKVDYTGIEAEVQARLSDNITFDGSLGYVDVKFKEFLGGLSTTGQRVDIAGAGLVAPGYTSPFTANAALSARFPLGMGDTELTARIGYTYEDGKFSFNNNLGAPFNDQIKGDNRSLVDAQIGIERIALGSGEGFVRIWGKNLTNRHDFVRGIDFGALGYAGGYYGDPRTYGITFGVKF